MVTLIQAGELRKGQAEIRRLVEERMQYVMDYLVSRRSLTPEQFRNALISQTNLVVNQFGDVAASMAAEWYEDIRLTEVGSSYRALTAQSPYGPDAVEGMVRRGVAPLFSEAPDLSGVMKTVSSNAGKYVLGASRETIRRNTFRDDKANGWKRVTRAGACKFCRMLSGRGGVYMRETAFFASHIECNCAAVPSFEMSAPEVDVKLYEVSVRTSKMSPQEKALHNSRVQSFIESAGL